MIPKLLTAILSVSMGYLAGCSRGPTPSHREEVAQVLDVLAKASEDICFSDLQSLYIFHPNGNFELEPLGLSGEAIRGKWKLRANMVEVTGLWSWINGISANDDYRTMVMNVRNIDSKSTDHASQITGKTHKVRKTDFVIESLERQTR